MNIFILAGGFGTRLKSVVSDVPKPMAPILNKPFLDYQIKEIKKYFPTTTIYLLTYFKSDIIEQYYKDDKYITIIKEDSPKDTGGCIKNAIEVLNLKTSNSLLILNGDTYIKPNLKDLVENTIENITILSSYQDNCSRYGTLNIQNNLIHNFNEKNIDSKNNYINAGCYYFKTLDFFNNIKKDVFSIENEFKKYLEHYGKIHTYKYNDIFIDIGIPKDYTKMIHYIRKNENA